MKPVLLSTVAAATLTCEFIGAFGSRPTGAAHLYARRCRRTRVQLDRVLSSA